MSIDNTPPRPGFSPIGFGSRSRAPFVVLPVPGVMFARRAARFKAGALAPYLTVLAGLAGAHARGALLTDDARRGARIEDALEEPVAMADVAGFMLAAAGVQVHLACLAAGLPRGELTSVAEGACPCSGRPPLASLVRAWGARFAACGAQWNVVRVKCASCGWTGADAYQEIEGSTDGIQAEPRDSCGLYVKIVALETHPGLDRVAHDVASLALDLKLCETVFRRGGVNPFLAGM